MSLSQTTIIEQLKTVKNDVFAQYNLITLGLFGSYAKNTYTDESDIDIFYEIAPKHTMSLKNYLHLEETLHNLFHKPIELVNLKKMNPLVKFTASKDFIYV